jgi:hypothetical protein
MNANRAITALLDSLIDYAGLFPPAGLGMRDAVRKYASYRESAEAQALARFVCPASRLGELRDEWQSARELLHDSAREPLRVAALVASVVDFESIARFQETPGAIVDVIEAKAGSESEIETLLASLPAGIVPYFELPLNDHLDVLVAALREYGSRAKIRTGGVTPEAFPAASQITAFIASCAAAGVPFKATAGLHHPLRCTRPLTYEPDSVTGTMHGFVNVFLAATLLRDGADPDWCARLLEDRDASHFEVTDDGIGWGGEFVTSEAIAEARRDFAISFGSCSFEEPIGDLRALGWL